MLSKKENFLQTLLPNGKPDRLIKQFEGTVFLTGDPVNYYVRGDRFREWSRKKIAGEQR